VIIVKENEARRKGIAKAENAMPLKPGIYLEF